MTPGLFSPRLVRREVRPRRTPADSASCSVRGWIVVCVSLSRRAIGACRALTEAGLQVGRDVSVCTFGGDGACRFHTPSITCLEHADPAPYLRLWCEWIGRSCSGWVGPLALRLPDRLFHGESTAPPGGWPNGQQRISGPVPGTSVPPAATPPEERQ